MANVFSRAQELVSRTRNAVRPNPGVENEVRDLQAAPAPTEADVTIDGAVAVLQGPIGDIAADVDTDVVLVTNPVTHTVALLDGSARGVEAAIRVMGEPVAAVIAKDRAYVSTTSESHDAVDVIDTDGHAVIATYPLAFSVASLAVSPNGKRVYVGRAADDHVDIAVIDTTAERVGTIDVAAGPGIGIDAVRLDGAGRRIYAAATDAHGSRVVVIDAETASVETTLRVGAPIRDLAIGPDGTAFVLTSDRIDGGSVVVVDLDANQITDRIPVGLAPTQLALSPDGTCAYVVDYNGVAVVCTVTGEVLDTITVDARPSAVAVSAGGDRLHVADYAGGVTTFAVAASTMPLLHSLFIPANPVVPTQARELAPA